MKFEVDLDLIDEIAECIYNCSWVSGEEIATYIKATITNADYEPEEWSEDGRGQIEKELAIAEKYTWIAVKHREFMRQPVEDLAEYHPDKFRAMCDEVSTMDRPAILDTSFAEFREYMSELSHYYVAEEAKRRKAEFDAMPDKDRQVAIDLLDHLLKECEERMGENE